MDEEVFVPCPLSLDVDEYYPSTLIQTPRNR